MFVKLLSLTLVRSRMNFIMHSSLPLYLEFPMLICLLSGTLEALRLLLLMALRKEVSGLLPHIPLMKSMNMTMRKHLKDCKIE